jgi:hypothetical protein
MQAPMSDTADNRVARQASALREEKRGKGQYAQAM